MANSKKIAIKLPQYLSATRLLTLDRPVEIAKEKIKMKAWQIHSYGGLEELQCNLARIPVIKKPNDIMIRVEAASLNPIDQIMINGYGKNVLSMFRGYELEFPLTLGRDFAGEIVDKGHGVSSDLKIGDKVYGFVPLHKPGSHAENLIVDDSMVCHKPVHLSPVEAASIPYAGLTAWSSLFVTGELALKSAVGKKILILGASGGIGTIAIQLLSSQAVQVYATCNADARVLVESLGAVLVFDYSSNTFLKDIALAGHFDIILDCAKFGYENVPKDWNYNKYVTLNSPLVYNTDKYGIINGTLASAFDLIKPNLARCARGKSVRWGFFAPSPKGLKFIDELVKIRQIKPVIHKVFKFKEIPEAFQFISQGHLRGKVVVDMSDI